MQRISLAGFSYPAGATRPPDRTCPARKYDLAGDLRVLESETARVYSLIRPPRTGRTGGQRGACARWRRMSGVAISGALSCRPSPTVGCRSRRHSSKPSGRGTAGGSGELDAAGLSWTSWDVIQKVHRADQAHSETTDATRTERGIHTAGKEKQQVSGYSDGWGSAHCKTVGLAYVGSNPTPATRNPRSDPVPVFPDAGSDACPGAVRQTVPGGCGPVVGQILAGQRRWRAGARERPARGRGR